MLQRYGSAPYALLAMDCLCRRRLHRNAAVQLRCVPVPVSDRTPAHRLTRSRPYADRVAARARRLQQDGLLRRAQFDGNAVRDFDLRGWIVAHRHEQLADFGLLTGVDPPGEDELLG